MDSAAWDARYGQAELVWGAEPNRFVAAELADLAPGRALDLAAGEGRNAIWLAGKGWRVTAVDFSAVAIDRGRQLAADRGVDVDWVVADLSDYRPEPAAFDAVVVAYLHLVWDLLQPILVRAASAVAPGGHLVIVFHDLSNLDDGVGGPQDPEVLYTSDAVADCLAGLDIVRAGRVLRPVATDDGERMAIDGLVAATRP